MRILALFPTPGSRIAGYTLLEILFVLTLVGLVGSLVIPRVDVLYDRVALSSQREDALNALRSYPGRARSEGVLIDLSDAEGLGMLAESLGESWSITVSQGLRYLPNGFCTGGEVRLTHRAGSTWTYRLEAPYCAPKEVSDASG